MSSLGWYIGQKSVICPCGLLPPSHSGSKPQGHMLFRTTVSLWVVICDQEPVFSQLWGPNTSELQYIQSHTSFCAVNQQYWDYWVVGSGETRVRAKILTTKIQHSVLYLPICMQQIDHAMTDQLPSIAWSVLKQQVPVEGESTRYMSDLLWLFKNHSKDTTFIYLKGAEYGN